MTENMAQETKELYCSVNRELNNQGQEMIKYAFFSDNFALAIRVPWESATKMISGLREQTLAITREIMQEENRGDKPSLEVVKEVPDALRNSARRQGL